MRDKTSTWSRRRCSVDRIRKDRRLNVSKRRRRCIQLAGNASLRAVTVFISGNSNFTLLPRLPQGKGDARKLVENFSPLLPLFLSFFFLFLRNFNFIARTVLLLPSSFPVETNFEERGVGESCTSVEHVIICFSRERDVYERLVN